MLTLTGNGRLTKKPELRETTSGAKVTTVAIASSRRGSDDDPIYVDLVLWDAQAAFAAQHLVKGQAVTFTGRLEPAPVDRPRWQHPHLDRGSRRRARVRRQAARRHRARPGRGDLGVTGAVGVGALRGSPTPAVKGDRLPDVSQVDRDPDGTRPAVLELGGFLRGYWPSTTSVRSTASWRESTWVARSSPSGFRPQTV